MIGKGWKIFYGIAANIGCLRVIEWWNIVRNINEMEIRVAFNNCAFIAATK